MSAETPQRITWNTTEAAEAIGVTERHLRRLISNGEGPPVVRLGRRVVLRPEAVENWLRDKERIAA